MIHRHMPYTYTCCRSSSITEGGTEECGKKKRGEGGEETERTGGRLQMMRCPVIAYRDNLVHPE